MSSVSIVDMSGIAGDLSQIAKGCEDVAEILESSRCDILEVRDSLQFGSSSSSSFVAAFGPDSFASDEFKGLDSVEDHGLLLLLLRILHTFELRMSELKVIKVFFNKSYTHYLSL